MRKLGTLFVLIATLFVGATLSFGQDEAEKSGLIKFVEEQLSTPNRIISLNGLEGTLSSNVSLASITIADKKGVWLTVVKPKLVWTRSALLTGKLDIDSLEAESIDYLRNPEPDDSLPAPEASGFSLPELPVSVFLRKLSVPRISFGEPVFGLAAETSINGNIALADGALDLQLAIKRLDGPGGSFDIKGKYEGSSKVLDLDVKLSEPEDGIIANLLDLEGRPPVGLSIKGNAPVNDLKVDLAFDVDSRRILAGDIRLNGIDDATRIRLNLGGSLASILPERTRDFFGLESRIDAEVLLANSGDVDVRSLNLRSGVVDLSATAKRLADGFISALKLDLALKSADGNPISLPTSETPVRLAAAQLALDYDAANNDAWTGRLKVNQFQRDGITVKQVSLDADGTVTGFNDPNNRAIEFTLDGLLDGFEAAEPALNDAVGKTVKLVGGGSWKTASPLLLQQFSIIGETVRANTSGEIANNRFDGSFELDTSDLSAFSGLAERPLTGRAALRADGNVALIGGAFDLRINGTTKDLGVAVEQVDPLLAGRTTLAGAIARSENGLAFRKLRLANNKFETSLDGTFSSKQTDLMLDAILRNAATLTPQAAGEVKLKAILAGTQKPYDLSAAIGMLGGRISERKVEGLALSFSGLTDGAFVRGNVLSQGTLDSKPVKLSGYVNADASVLSLQKLLVEVGGTRLTGGLKRAETGLIDASLNIDADDISDLAALALADASGSINGTITLASDGGKQKALANVTTRNLRYQDYRVQSGTINANGEDLFGNPAINALLDVSGIRAAGVEVRSLDGTIKTAGKDTDFDIQASLDQNNARVQTKGRLTQNNGTMSLRLDGLSINSNITDARLREPTTFSIANGVTRFSGASLSVGSGGVRLSGSAGKQLDIDIGIESLPLSIINAVQPQTGAAGVVSGKATVTGASANPAVVFNLDGSGVSARQLATAGLSPLAVSASGRFADKVLTLERATASNSQQLSVSASGRIPLSGPGLSLSAAGTAPLSLARSALASRGASASGNARFDVNVQGSLSSPQTSGLIAIENGALSDPLSNLKLANIGLLAGLNGQQLTISRASADLSSGGTISAAGSIGLGAAMPANIAVTMSGARYTDGQTFVTTADGRLDLTGNLAGDPLLGGNITLGKTEITVPETFAKGSNLLEVDHVGTSTKARQTLDRLERATPKGRPQSRPSVLRLDITIDAPSRIFVRGRGLDAELGGRIRITGPVTGIRPIGKFSLRRGRLSILGQRIDLTEGSITLAGDLDPLLDLQATTQAGDVEAYINLKGKASDIKVTFSSSPELPQDEVLAKIIFGRGLGDLSPGQIVRLASIAAELTGGNSPGLVDGIRKGTGLDDLDVVQDDEGNTAVKAGKYINDNVYLGVQAGTTKTEATINLDITDNITARGAVSSEGNTSIGIFLEKDY